MKRPKRKAIPKSVRMEVCQRQLFLCARCHVRAVHYLPGTETEFDHEPALRLRNIAEDGSDYDPPQNHPGYIDALCEPCHAAKTHGSGATTAGTDAGKIKKERRRLRSKRKYKWAPRKMPKRVVKWPKRKMGRGGRARPSSGR